MSISSKFFNKRGLSPLIATVLLISFAVALGSVVLNWGRNLDISRPGDKCTGASIKLRDINGFEACYSDSGDNAHIKFILDNNGNVDVDGFGIWVTGEKGTKLIDLNDISLKKGGLLSVKEDTVKYDFKLYGAIKSIQFFPKVKAQGSIDICARNAVKAQNIGSC